MVLRSGDNTQPLGRPLQGNFRRPGGGEDVTRSQTRFKPLPYPLPTPTTGMGCGKGHPPCYYMAKRDAKYAPFLAFLPWMQRARLLPGIAGTACSAARDFFLTLYPIFSESLHQLVGRQCWGLPCACDTGEESTNTERGLTSMDASGDKQWLYLVSGSS